MKTYLLADVDFIFMNSINPKENLMIIKIMKDKCFYLLFYLLVYWYLAQLYNVI